jgi:hypothetical protein
MTACNGASDCDGGLRQGSTVEAKETLPGNFATQGASLSEGQLGRAKGSEKRDLLDRVWTDFGSQAMIALRADGLECGGEFVAGEVARFRGRTEPKPLDEFKWESG